MVTYFNPYYLKYFVDAVDLGSISASAQKNLISHPAVSKAIRVLESELQIKLLKHQKKNFEVTKEGFQFAIQTKKLLDQLGKLGSESIDQELSVQGTFSLGISRTIGQIYLKEIICLLEKKLPNIQLDIRFGTTGDLLEKLLKGSLDTCLTIGRQTIPTLTQNKLKEGNFVLIQAHNKNTEVRDSLTNFILTEPRYETELLKKLFSRKFKKNLQVKHQVGSWEVICELVAANLGIGLVPDLLLDGNKKIKIIKQSLFNCPYGIYLNKRNGPQTQLHKVVADLISDTMRK